MPLVQFLIFTAIGANWDLAVDWRDQYQLAMITRNTGLILGIVVLQVRTYRQRRR